MPLLERKIRTKERYTFMVKLPVDVLRYLGLYSLAKGITRTKIIRDLVDDWTREAMVEETEEQLIDQVVERIDEAWYSKQKLARSLDEPEPDFNVFFIELEAEITRKDPRYAKKQKIDPEIAEKIMERVYETNQEFLKRPG